jgi:hypothetical protein
LENLKILSICSEKGCSSASFASSSSYSSSSSFASSSSDIVRIVDGINIDSIGGTSEQETPKQFHLPVLQLLTTGCDYPFVFLLHFDRCMKVPVVLLCCCGDGIDDNITHSSNDRSEAGGSGGGSSSSSIEQEHWAAALSSSCKGR